jgi:hypothetical protein
VGIAEAGAKVEVEVEANSKMMQVQNIMLPMVGGKSSCPCALGVACV